MREGRRRLVLCLAVIGPGIGFSPACALDPGMPATGSSPFDFFRTGVSAYKNGQTDEAIRALRYAAEMGHTGAKWKLARMYAEGDGVPENDLEAYNFFLKIVQEGADPGSQNASYISDALVALGDYMRIGIAKTSVRPDPERARACYLQAAINYGNPVAQFELGKMLLLGEGGEKNLIQAARWFQLAARKGNPGAQAMFGSMLFQAGKTVRGLAMMTAAFERARPADRDWIRPMQERAFAIAGEADRRTAVSLATDIVANNSF